MLLPQRKDRLRTFTVKANGSIDEGEPILVRNSLFAEAFGLDNAALFRLHLPKKEGFDQMASKLRLANALDRGSRGYRALGSGHGLKKGKVYGATPHVLHQLRGLYSCAEDALAYGSLLFSEATHLLRLDSARLTEKGGGDGQGWIDTKVLEEHGLPIRQIQVRALWPNALAKGTLLPVEGLREKEGCDVLFHDTQVKSKSKDLAGSFLLAIRDTAEVRTFNSSWTWTQFLDEELQEKVFEKYARPMLQAVRRAMESNDSALAFLDCIPCTRAEERERRDLLTSLLASGLSPRHPWVHRRMQELVRRTYLDAALGLGPVPLSGGMACVVEDDRCRHHVTANWLPEGGFALMRYPVRDGWSLRMVRNVHKPGVPEGSIAVHPGLMVELDGDQDGDWVALCADREVQRGVQRMHRGRPSRLPIPPRTRKRSSLFSLPAVAVDAMGASGIGTPTWLVAACIDQKKEDLIPKLSLALQCATLSLKWSVERDWEFLAKVADETPLPEWLELAQDKDVFAVKAPKVPDVGLGRFWNLAVEAFEEDTLGTRGSLQEFRHLVALPQGDPDILAEVETLRQAFHKRVASSNGDDEVIAAAIEDVREWAKGKVGRKRVEYARSAWFLCHRNPSPQSSGSFAIHAFPDVLVRDVQKTTGYRSPVHCPEAAECSTQVEVIEGRTCLRSQEPVRIELETRQDRNLTLRLVGGSRVIAAQYGVPEREAEVYLDRVVAAKGPDPVPVSFSWVNAPWNGHRVILATMGDDPLGYVPEERASAVEHRILGQRMARLLVRGKCVVAVVTE